MKYAIFDSNTVTVGDFNSPLTSTDRSDKNTNKKTMTLNNTLDQTDLKDTYRPFHPQTAEHNILFKYTWDILQDRVHVRPQNKFQ